MAHNPTDRAAVDEGRDPYGLPGRGNANEVWRRLNAVPCPFCGATSKSLVVEDGRATITCRKVGD